MPRRCRFFSFDRISVRVASFFRNATLSMGAKNAGDRGEVRVGRGAAEIIGTLTSIAMELQRDNVGKISAPYSERRGLNWGWGYDGFLRESAQYQSTGVLTADMFLLSLSGAENVFDKHDWITDPFLT